MNREQLSLVLKQKYPLHCLAGFLNNQDLLALAATSKQVKQLTHSCIIKPKPKKSQKSVASNVKQPKVADKELTIIDETFRLSTFDVKTAPKTVFVNPQQNWKYTAEIPEKLAASVEKFYAGFRSLTNGKDMLFVHRALVDRSLEFYGGGFDDEEDDYEQLHSGKQFVDNFDFQSQESMRERQKHILGLFTQKTKLKETKEMLEFQNELEKIPSIRRISIILCFGGSFSLGIFQKGKCILHKSDKKYVVRGKAGGRQLNKDKCSGTNIQSMGSQIRRHQQKLHQQNVSSILEQTQEELKLSDFIFLQAPGLNRKIIIEGSEALSRLKHKLRSVCVSARKANFQNVQEVFQLISKVYILRVR